MARTRQATAPAEPPKPVEAAVSHDGSSSETASEPLAVSDSQAARLEALAAIGAVAALADPSSAPASDGNAGDPGAAEEQAATGSPVAATQDEAPTSAEPLTVVSAGEAPFRGVEPGYVFPMVEYRSGRARQDAHGVWRAVE